MSKSRVFHLALWCEKKFLEARDFEYPVLWWICNPASSVSSGIGQKTHNFLEYSSKNNNQKVSTGSKLWSDLAAVAVNYGKVGSYISYNSKGGETNKKILFNAPSPPPSATPALSYRKTCIYQCSCFLFVCLFVFAVVFHNINKDLCHFMVSYL